MGRFTIMSARSRTICLASCDTGFVTVYLFSSGKIGITELDSCRQSGHEYSPLLTSRLYWPPWSWNIIFTLLKWNNQPSIFGHVHNRFLGKTRWELRSWSANSIGPGQTGLSLYWWQKLITFDSSRIRVNKSQRVFLVNAASF